MSATQYVTPALGSLTYDQRAPSNFGESYAAGIGSAGKSLSDAITSIGGQYLQNRDVDDTLAAMSKNGILSKEEYDSVSGKSTAAKQQVLGLYAGQWIANQAEDRAAALQKGQGVTQIAVEHAKLLDTINAVRSGYGPAAGVASGKLPASTAAPAAPAPAPAPAAPVVGPPVAKNMLLKPGVIPGQMTDPKSGQVIRGWQMPDGTFRPNP